MPAVPGYTASAVLAEANVSQSAGNQPDAEAMIKRAEKLRKDGQLEAAAAIWEQILSNTMQQNPSTDGHWLFLRKFLGKTIQMLRPASTI
mgnify:CR=1 FL=1